MSASLVGSEMCIRDRRRRRPFLVSRARGLRGRARRVEGDSRNHHAGEASVSYTHLTLPTICSV
eukprot:12260416-Alexandrium_andersonii.AAC.1